MGTDRKQRVLILFAVTAVGIDYLVASLSSKEVQVARPVLAPISRSLASVNSAPGSETKKSQDVAPADSSFNKHDRRRERLAKREAWITQSLSEVGFEQDHSRHNFLKDIFAIPEREVESEKGLQVLERRNGYIIYRREEGRRIPGELPVVYSSERQTIGVVTGKIIAKLHESVSAKEIAQDHQLALLREFLPIRTGYFGVTFQQERDLIAAFERVKGDPRIKHASLELVDRTIVPR